MFDVLNYIHKNILKPLTSTQTAEMFGYSKWHFCKKFHEFTNMTFSEYVRHYKIQLAAITDKSDLYFRSSDRLREMTQKFS